MEVRIYRYRKAPIWRMLAIILVASLPFAGLLTALISTIGQLDPSRQGPNIHPDYRIVFGCCYAVVVLAFAVGISRARKIEARVEVKDGELLEYDQHGRLLVRAGLNSVQAIERVRLFHHDAYFVHFANGQLAVVGNGLEGFAELRRTLLARIPGEPIELRFDDISGIMKIVNNRPAILG